MPSSDTVQLSAAPGISVGLLVLHDQAFEQVAQDVRFVDGRRLVRVERFRIGGVAAVVDHLGEGRDVMNAPPATIRLVASIVALRNLCIFTLPFFGRP